MAGRCGCSEGCGCVAASTSSVEVTGIGTPGAPFAPAVVVSSDEGNVAGLGDDGGVYVGLCAVAPNGNPVPPDGDGCLLLPPPVILDYAGDPIAPEPDGSIQLPPGSGAPSFGCGLGLDGDDLVVETTGTWPLDDLAGDPLDGAGTVGGPLFCDGAGAVRTAPEHTTVAFLGAPQQLLVSPPELVAQGATWTSPTAPAVTVTNPSPARRLTGVREVELTGTVWAPTAWRVWVVLEASPDGVTGWGELGRWDGLYAVADASDTPLPVDAAGASIQQVRVLAREVVDVPAGGTVDVYLRASVLVAADPETVDPPLVQVRALAVQTGYHGGTV